MTAGNFLAYSLQIALLIALCAGLPRLIGLRAPGVQHVFWRTVLVVCLLLPLVQPWRTITFDVTVAKSGGSLAGQTPVATANEAMAFVPARAPFDWGAAVPIVLLAGIGARLAWITIGVGRLIAMRRRCRGISAAGFEDLQAAIGTKAPILWSADVRHPVTFGVLDPVVLLPAALKSVDLGAQRAVVAHELLHVKRRDWAWVLGEEIVRSIFWFHPAMWWLVSRVQLARETVVDELSILVTNARRTYLDTLLAFADDTGLTSSPAFSARRHLFYRVMLLSKEGGMSSLRVAVGSCVLIVALGAGSWSAVTAFPLYGEPQPQVQPQTQPARDQKPPRDPLTPEHHHRVAVELWDKANKDLSLTREQKVDTILRGIAAEDRALAINPDYIPALVYKNIFLRMQANMTDHAELRNRLVQQAEELRQKAIALRGIAPPPPPPPDGTMIIRTGKTAEELANMPPPPPPAPPMPAAAMTDEYRAAIELYKPHRIGGVIKAPEKIRDVKPVYPPIAQSAKIQGVVIIEALLAPDGTVVVARVLRSIPLLDEAALDAVRQWVFTPPLVDGTPQAVVMTVTVNFRLE